MFSMALESLVFGRVVHAFTQVKKWQFVKLSPFRPFIDGQTGGSTSCKAEFVGGRGDQT